MKRGILKVLNCYHIVPAMVSISIHAALLWFIALCFSNTPSRKTPRHQLAAMINFSEALRINNHLNQPQVHINEPKSDNKRTHSHIAKKIGHTSDTKTGHKQAQIESVKEGSLSSSDTNAAHSPRLPFRPYPQLVNGDEVKVPYPERARQLMIEGVVRLRLTVSEAGRVVSAEVLSGPAFGLRNAALKVARKFFFLPATDEQGQAKTAFVEHDVVFRLNQRS